MLFAGVAQLVERNLAKVDVVGSNPISRSSFPLEDWSEAAGRSVLVRKIGVYEIEN